MNYLKALKTLLRKEEFEKVSRIDNAQVHQFLYESIKLCQPREVFVCSDTPDEIAYIKNMAIVSGEESAALLTPGRLG